ncbi:MAG: hypothetical protein K2M94_08915 [Paramuribaculum sp.]|nr:hypothetical protein [Paramuribaculum sp.]
MKHNILILSILTIVCPVLLYGQSSRFTIKAYLDSAHLIMGRQTDIKIEVLGPVDSTSSVTSIDSMWKKIELVSLGDVKITDMGNGQSQLTQNVTVQAFEPGLYSVPAFMFIQGGDTVISSRPALKVLPVEADSLNGFENVVSVNDDNIPLIDLSAMSWIWWTILVIILLAVIGIIIYKYYKKGNIQLPLKSVAKPVPPYELAMIQLNQLKEEHLWERGADKLYHTKLTDILRTYLQGRFGLNAMEMTSSQILNALRTDGILPELYSRMNSVLSVADFVKFAKLKPTREENESSFNTVVKFVEDTKPVEVSETTSDSNTVNPNTNTPEEK